MILEAQFTFRTPRRLGLSLVAVVWLALPSPSSAQMEDTTPQYATASRFVGPVVTKFVYVANSQSNNVSGFTMQRGTGVLTPVAGSPFNVVGSPWSIALDASSRFAYTTSVSNEGIDGFSIDPQTGGLLPLLGSPFDGHSGWSSVSVATDPTSKFAYVTFLNGDYLWAYTIDSRSGALARSQISPVEPVANLDLAVHPSGRFIYMTQECIPVGNVCDSTLPNSVLGYASNAITGALTPISGSPFPSGQGARSLAIDPTGRFLYVGNGGSLDISAYTIDAFTGVLTPIPGSPFMRGSYSPLAISLDRKGRFLYVTRGDAKVWGYRIDPDSGVLTGMIVGSPWGSGQGNERLSLSLAVDCTSQFLYSANWYSGNVSAYAIDSETGSLTEVLGSPFPTGNGPRAIAVACTSPPSDTTPPVIVPQIIGTLGNNGWYISNVTVTWSVTDPESGIASSTGCSTTTLTNDIAGITLSCTATNGAGLASTVGVTVKIDKTPPVISGMPAAGCFLWPPNGKLVQVATVAAADALSGLGSLQVTGASNEPFDPNTPDIVAIPNARGGYVVQLRADRLGTGTGRVYTLNTTASDLAGNTATVTATCTVPHDQEK